MGGSEEHWCAYGVSSVLADTFSDGSDRRSDHRDTVRGGQARSGGQRVSVAELVGAGNLGGADA